MAALISDTATPALLGGSSPSLVSTPITTWEEPLYPTSSLKGAHGDS